VRAGATLKTGMAGLVIATICCFTPVLLLPGAVGLSVRLGWLDYVLQPAMALFIGLAALGFWGRQRAATCCDVKPASTKESGRG